MVVELGTGLPQGVEDREDAGVEHGRLVVFSETM